MVGSEGTQDPVEVAAGEAVAEAMRAGRPAVGSRRYSAIAPGAPARSCAVDALTEQGYDDHARLLELIDAHPELLVLDRRSVAWSAIATGLAAVLVIVVAMTRLTMPSVADKLSVVWWAAIVAATVWRSARLVTIRGFERAALDRVGLHGRDRRLVRSLYDDALYHQVDVSGSGVLVAVIATTLLVGLVVAAVAAGATGRPTGVALVVCLVLFTVLVALTTADFWRMWQRPQLVPLERRPDVPTTDADQPSTSVPVVACPDVEAAVPTHLVAQHEDRRAIVDALLLGDWSAAVAHSARNVDAAADVLAQLRRIGATTASAIYADALADAEPWLAARRRRVIGGGAGVIAAVLGTSMLAAAVGPPLRSTLLVAGLIILAWGALAGAAIVVVGAAVALRRAASSPTEGVHTCGVAIASFGRSVTGTPLAWGLAVVRRSLVGAVAAVAAVILAVRQPGGIVVLGAAVVFIGIEVLHVALEQRWRRALAPHGLATPSPLSAPPPPEANAGAGETRLAATRPVPILVPRPRPWPFVAVGALGVGVAALGPLSRNLVGVVVGVGCGVALFLVAVRRYDRSAVLISERGITDVWMWGTRFWPWSDVVPNRAVTPGALGVAAREVVITTWEGETFSLVTAPRWARGAEQLRATIDAHARGRPERHAGSRRALRFIVIPAIVCVLFGLVGTTIAIPFTSIRMPVNPAAAPAGSEVFTARGIGPYVRCPSVVAWVGGDQPEACADAVSGQFVPFAIFVAVDLAAIGGVVLLSRRSRRRRRRRRDATAATPPSPA